jgi:hypothetical protein
VTPGEILPKTGKVAGDRGGMGRREDNAASRPPEEAAQREACPDERDPDSNAGSHGCA